MKTIKYWILFSFSLLSLSVWAKPHADTIRIALMLPLYLDELDSLKVNEKHNTFNEKLFTYLPFYQGAALALEKEHSLGSVFDLKIYDITEDAEQVKRAIQDSFLPKADLIIAFSFAKAFTALANFAKEKQIPILHPFSQRNGLAQQNPFVIQATPSSNMQISEWGQYAAEKYGKHPFYILSDHHLESNRKAALFQQNLQQNNSTKNIRVKNFNISDSTIQMLLPLLKEGEDNIICAFFEKEISFTTTVINLIRSHKKVYLLGAPKWLEFDKVEAAYLQKLNFHYYSPFYVDYANSDIIAFEELFYNQYTNLPGEMAFLGYDCLSFCMEFLSLHKGDILGNLDGYRYDGLGFNYHFEKQSSGVFENTHIFKLKLHRYEFIPQE